MWHEWYRRSQSNVFLWLEKGDPRYRALRMIEAAEDVLRNEGRSSWGWMVYYAEAETRLYVAVRSAPGGSGRPGVDPQEGGESTPRPEPRAGGPSSGSGK